MAPKGTKRPASFDGGRLLKKPASGKENVAAQCRQIAYAIESANVPAEVKAILTGSLLDCFGTFAADRHPYQVKIIGMVAETLASVQVNHEKSVFDSLTSKEAVAAEMVTKVSASEAAEATEAAARLAEVEANEKVSASKTKLTEAKAALKDAESKLKTAESESAAAKTNQVTLAEFLNDFLKPMKESKLDAAGVKDCILRSKTVGKLFTLDETMMAALPSTFRKEPAAWGTFDTIVVKEFEDKLGIILADLNAKVAAGEDALKAPADAVEIAKAGVQEAEIKHEEAITAETASKAASKDAYSVAVAATRVVNSFKSDVKKASEAHETAVAELEALTEGAMTAYKALEALAPPPEPEPEKAEGDAIEPAAAAPVAPEPLAAAPVPVAPADAVTMDVQ